MPALLKVLRECGIDEATMTDAEIDAAATESYNKYRSSYDYFIDRFDIDRLYMHENVPMHIPVSGIATCGQLVQKFAACPRRHVINTHAPATWTMRVLEHIGLTQYFEPTDMIHHCDFDYDGKDKSPTTHLAALAIAGVEAAHAVMIEDTINNLHIPYELGMKTILVSNKPGIDVPDFIDAVVPRAADVFDLLAMPANARLRA
jgi:FMN phosphatase YigB (HAD superfamily)